MNLDRRQSLWMGGVLLLAIGLALDVAGVINPSSLLWLALSGLLLATGWVMPSVTDIQKINRRG